MATVCLALGAANPWDTWHWRYPDPTGNALASVAWGEDRFVAVGELGTVLVSFDGAHWDSVTSGIRSGFEFVAYGGGTFLALGPNGEIFTCPDGYQLTPQWAGTLARLRAAAWGNGRWVVVGEQGVIITSTDAQNWKLVSFLGDNLVDVA